MFPPSAWGSDNIQSSRFSWVTVGASGRSGAGSVEWEGGAWDVRESAADVGIVLSGGCANE